MSQEEQINDPVIHSIKKSSYYKYDEKIALVIVCRKYDQLRKLHGMEFYQDLDQVLVDKENAVSYLKML